MICQPEVYPQVVIWGFFIQTYIAEFTQPMFKCLVHFKEDCYTSYRLIHLAVCLSIFRDVAIIKKSFGMNF